MNAAGARVWAFRVEVLGFPPGIFLETSRDRARMCCLGQMIEFGYYHRTPSHPQSYYQRKTVRDFFKDTRVTRAPSYDAIPEYFDEQQSLTLEYADSLLDEIAARNARKTA